MGKAKTANVARVLERYSKDGFEPGQASMALELEDGRALGLVGSMWTADEAVVAAASLAALSEQCGCDVEEWLTREQMRERALEDGDVLDEESEEDEDEDPVKYWRSKEGKGIVTSLVTKLF